jgi:hypothetical protein
VAGPRPPGSASPSSGWPIFFCEAELTLLLLFWKRRKPLDVEFCLGRLILAAENFRRSRTNTFASFPEESGNGLVVWGCDLLRSRANGFTSFLERKSMAQCLVTLRSYLVLTGHTRSDGNGEGRGSITLSPR